MRYLPGARMLRAESAQVAGRSWAPALRSQRSAATKVSMEYDYDVVIVGCTESRERLHEKDELRAARRRVHLGLPAVRHDKLAPWRRAYRVSTGGQVLPSGKGATALD